MNELDIKKNSEENIDETTVHKNKVEFTLKCLQDQLKSISKLILPETIHEKVPFLTYLDLSNSNLNYLPDSLSQLPLKYFNLSRNFLTEVPNCLYLNLYNIEHLDISHNLINTFIVPNCVLSLSILKINNNKFIDFPAWIWESSVRLKELTLSCNGFNMKNYGVMFKTYLSTSRLIKLYMVNCNLSSSDVIILDRIPNLLELDIGNVEGEPFRNTWDLPISHLHCKNNLVKLSIKNLSLSSLSCNISDLKKLTQIYLSNNNLHWLPENFMTLQHLEVCELSNNSLSYLTDSFLTLSNLKELYLANNNFNKLPDLRKLKCLKILDVYNNELEDFDYTLIDSLDEIDLEQNFLIRCSDRQIDNKTCLLRKRISFQNESRMNGQKVRNICEDDDAYKEHDVCLSSEEDDSTNNEEIVDICPCNEELWDSEYLDDHFVPSPLHSRSQSISSSSVSPAIDYDLFEIFCDAD